VRRGPHTVVAERPWVGTNRVVSSSECGRGASPSGPGRKDKRLTSVVCGIQSFKLYDHSAGATTPHIGSDPRTHR
jgi:hypothetical protein